jgi:hypothetical protein
MKRARVIAVCRRQLAALLVSSCVWSAAPAFAQNGDEARSRVEALLRQGMQRREAGRDAEALEYYRQALELQPENARTLAHLGATYQALGRWVPAQNYLRQALSHTGDAYIERHETELSEALAVVSEHLGQLEVYGGPPGAEVLLNGQPVAKLPMAEPLSVTVGSYLLEVQAPGHYTLGRPINVQPRLLTREEVGLAPHRAGGGRVQSGRGPVSEDAPVAQRPRELATDGSGGPRWLPWVLGGAALASGQARWSPGSCARSTQIAGTTTARVWGRVSAARSAAAPSWTRASAPKPWRGSRVVPRGC